MAAIGHPIVGDGKYDVAKRTSFGVMNGRIGIQSDRFGLAVFANNLLNKRMERFTSHRK
jgi:iron complex outermembrane receptor protein